MRIRKIKAAPNLLNHSLKAFPLFRFLLIYTNFIRSEFVFVFFFFSLIKEETQRPKYNKLLEHPFIKESDEAKLDISLYIRKILDEMESCGANMFTMNQP